MYIIATLSGAGVEPTEILAKGRYSRNSCAKKFPAKLECSSSLGDASWPKSVIVLFPCNADGSDILRWRMEILPATTTIRVICPSIWSG